MGVGDPPVTGVTHAGGPATPDEPTRLAVLDPPAYRPSPSGLLQPGAALGPRYRILAVLGAGGMGVVYKAWDEVLGVAVAMKVIRPEVMADPAIATDLEQRFKRELLLARQVTHRNVVRIHDIGEVHGMRYITMPFIEGVDLRTYLGERGTLSVPDTLGLARQIASGLQAAHDAGVVHRDLKPANIMFDGRLATLMDFGIARAEMVDGEAAAPRTASMPALASGMTVAGTVVGTAEYMAPEQLLGKPVDHRADIYAFGLIVRDMLLGLRPPLSGIELHDALMQRLQAPPESVRAANGAISVALDAVVQRCLQPALEARYQSMQEVLAALERLDDQGNPIPERRLLTPRFVGLLGVIAAALIAVTWWIVRPAPPPVVHPPMPLLVADFENPAGDPAFDGALEEALGIDMERASFITAFSRRQARQTAAQIKAGDKLTEPVAKLISRREELKVILAGRIDRQGDGYTVSVRALDPAADAGARPIAEASAFAAAKADVLPAVADVAATLRRALGETKTESARQAAGETFTAGSLEAMQAYARAQQLALANDYKGALQAYDRAIALDPLLGRAYTGIAVIYTNIFKDHQKADEYYKEAMRHVDRMTEREKYRTMGAYYLLGARNYDKAIETYDTLVRLYPADDVGHFNLALAMVNVGNVQGAVTEVRKGLEVHPGNSLQRYNYAVYSMYAGDFDTTIAQAKRLIDGDPGFEYNRQPLALASAARGDIAAARAEFDRLDRVSAFGHSMAQVGEADLEMYLGRPRAALAALGGGVAENDGAANGTIAQKLVASADVFLAIGDKARAAAAARSAIQSSTHEGILYPAARVLIAAGAPDEARQVASTLENMLQRQTIAYAKLLDGELAVEEHRIASAIEAFQGAQQRQDSWFSRFLLGRTYAQAGHYPEALRELELSVKRRGEATDAFFYDMPTLRYLPPAYYWLARTQEGIGNTVDARKTYEQFLALRHEAEPGDALVADARRRMSSTQ